MAAVLDASLLVAHAIDNTRAAIVRALLRRLLDEGASLHAPALLPYEVANGLARLVAANAFAADRLHAAWQAVLAVPIAYHALHVDGPEIIEIALRFGRRSAYDAAYLALTEQLGGELWTFDGPLVRNAAGLGFPVHLVG